MAGKVYDTERIVGKSPPMLKSISVFSNRKIMMKSYFKFTEHTIWESIAKRPHIPKTANADGLVPIADPDLYSEEDKKLIERDNRALGLIILALPTELYPNFEQHETAQGLWNALCLMFEGNAPLQESRTGFLLKQYNMFSYKKNETLSEQVTRFTIMINRIRKMGVKFEEYDLGKKLLDSLPDCWSIPCMLIKNTTPDLKKKSLDDIICLLESYELDVKKRELNNPDKPNGSGSANTALFSGTSDGSSGSKSEKGKGCCEHSSGEKVKTTGHFPEDQIALFGAFMSSYDALVTGKLQPAVHDVEDLVQINPDDLEYMDLQWKMAMIAVRAKKYLLKVGKDKLQFDKKKVEGSGVKLVEMIEENEKSKKSPTALMLKQLINCEWDDEIENAENEFDEALMAEIEVSKKTTEVSSDFALKSDDKGKVAASTSEENSSDSEVTSDDDSFICSSDCIEKMQNYHAANTFLIAENDKLKRVNKEIKQNEVTYTRKINALLKDNMNFKEYLNKKDVLIKDLTNKLIAAQSDLIKERVLISKWGMQRKILDNCVDKQRSCFIKDGVGYKAVPHLDHFEPFPEPHVSNDLIRDENSNFHDLYVSATNNTGHVDEKISVDDVRSFNEFNKVCVRETIRDCRQFVVDTCIANKFVKSGTNNVFDDVHSLSNSDSSYVFACSTNSVCDVSDCQRKMNS
ncbi:hypothetical protein L1987_46352 [Smallanthus sonchifolius]|uniref:Uncharacterized protein n=1 Tax=Smallanthus sonchifolius TaxID=185202 RepID=A0ACB9G0H2_9ASTR|nr:hypothetical protein L1987_46352 [Smallanthus sonchifolius]